MNKGKVAKAELAARISEQTGLSRKQAGDVVASAVGLMVDALKQGRTVGLPNLGTFSISQTSQRQGVRPGTTERITIPAGKKVRFKISTGLRDQL
ncbi:histone family protein DNA-binding protein [Deinococcus proteolyticus MRP]|uniref:Histone family protein DNA-binding protein n=1 Tax=Deinococcus proteolyticus (strain ATCC 35074 / DSM 20540 / JCM 6276 / NBRC 101906 / NCIMB 13154 / VKM Ac-1939 / CCM 2703 / MRP) TaxID=693977 RepID=F0RKT6_DEIPM|nr:MULTISPECIES: HU family DNA-binding protein [Deinococcus]ADY26798.1 histone family protein DNA-binding protein [Deinococcus proteolyticus MRP]MCY1702918.1 HU family DNA-binding protein [Deinococcus sp. SL84]